VDTSGYSLPANFEAIIPYTDLFLFDLKHLDSISHEKFTGVANSLILGNFKLLLDSGKDIIIRIPIIPAINDDPDHLEKLRLFLAENVTGNLKKICLLPYHKTGSSKYKRMNVPDRMVSIEPPSGERMKELLELFAVTGIKVKIGG
jgi:pyruvate formate lyase activating enzyme